MKATLDDRLKSVTTVTGRFTSVAFDPSNIREGSAQPPPDTPSWAIAEQYRDSSLKCVEEMASDEEGSLWEFNEDEED